MRLIGLRPYLDTERDPMTSDIVAQQNPCQKSDSLTPDELRAIEMLRSAIKELGDRVSSLERVKFGVTV